MTVQSELRLHIENQHQLNNSILNALRVFKDTDEVIHNSTLEAIERLTSLATSFETEINLLRDRIDTLEADAHSHD